MRLQGKSYSEIKEILRVPKSTLSNWLVSVPLTEGQLASLKAKKPKQVERFRKTMNAKKVARQNFAYQKALKEWLPLNDREKMLAGLFLYWGEGTKVSPGYLCISNCNPKVITFALHWLTNSLKVDRNKIKILLHLYSDMNVDEEIKYWSTLLNLKLENFRRPYIKNSTRAGLTYKSFGHGTCNIYVSNTILKEHVIESINAISDYYGKVDII